MNCHDLEELLSAYADGELPRTRKEFIEEHLAVCADCREILAEYVQAGRQLSSLRELPESPDIRGATIAEVKVTEMPSENPYGRWLRPVVAAGVMMIVLAVLLVAQPWNVNSSAVKATSIVRNSPEVQAVFNGENIREVEITTKVIGNEGDVLVVLVKTETRQAAAEVDLKREIVTDIVRVHVPELAETDAQKAIDIARADARVQELLAEGGIIGTPLLAHSVGISEVTGPDGEVVKEGKVEIIGQVPIESGGREWFATVDIDGESVIGLARQSTATLAADWSRATYTILNPAMLFLAVLILTGLILRNKLAGIVTAIFTIVLGVLTIYGGLYAWPIGYFNQIIALIVPALGIAIGITDIRRRIVKKWIPVIGIVLCSLALAWDSFNIVIAPDATPGMIAVVSVIVAGVIIYALKGRIMAIKVPDKLLRPAIIGLAAIAVLVLALVQPWSGPSPDFVLARAHDVASSFGSYHMSISAYTWNPEGTSEQSLDVKFSAPDRYHVVSLMNSAELPVDSVEYIVIGEKQYVRKFSDNFDINFIPGTPATESFLSRETTLEYLDNMADVEDLPDETVNSADCFHYAGIYDIAKSIASVQGVEVEELPKSLRGMYQQCELWIGKDDYLIRKMHTERQMVGNPEILGTVEMTIDYLSINEPVVIEPPVDADGNLLKDWELAGHISPGSGRPFLKSMTVSIGTQEGYDDYIHQEVRYTINLTNGTDEPVKNVRIIIATMLIAGDAEPVDVEAEPETPARVMAPGESRTFSARVPFDAGGYTKEQIMELRFMDDITIHFETEAGIQMTESLESPPYPSAVPPGNTPSTSGE